MNDRDAFIRAYIDAALFADTPEDYDGEGLSDEAYHTLFEDAVEFYEDHQCDIEAYSESAAEAGHDLWLTRNGHGCGYWEKESPAADRLNRAAKRLGSRDMYEGDDGLLYVV